MGENTSIQIKKKTKSKLDQLKLSRRDTYNDVIEYLIEDSSELNQETLKEIQNALEEYKQGKYITLEETKRELGL